MRIDGEWFLCGDGKVRPVIRGELLAADGSWVWTEKPAYANNYVRLFSCKAPPLRARHCVPSLASRPLVRAMLNIQRKNSAAPMR